MTDLLSSTTTAAKRGPVPTMAAIAIGMSAVLVAGVGTAVAVGSAIGGGQQPEDVLPASSIALAKVDLAPSLGQRKAVYDISKKFPTIDAHSPESIKDDLLEALFDQSGDLLDYDTDVKPWLGDRVGIAAVPNGKGSADPVAAIQYTDKEKARKALAEAQKESADDPFAFAFSGDYVIVATTQKEADDYAKADEHLSDRGAFNDAIDALDGDQLVLGWGDIKGVYDALPEEQRKNAKLDQDSSGSFVVGLHADSDYLEVQGKAVDVGDSLKQYGSTSFGAQPGNNLIATFPIQATAVMEVTGVGAALTEAYDTFADQEWFGQVNEGAAQFGLTLPQDLTTVFGNDLAVGVFGDLRQNPRVVAHIKTDDPDKAVSILKGVPSSEDTPPFAVEKDNDGGYFVGTDSGAIALATNGTLGESAPFKRALPDADRASFAVYVSIGRAAGLTDEAPDGLDKLEAFGMTASNEDGAFRMRLTFTD
ncbi:MAG: DUF3352 domain-containing protein [Frankiaceae bacterium]|nr:DUF3352 domain-containing protein [Frankiaceae bacterium]